MKRRGIDPHGDTCALVDVSRAELYALIDGMRERSAALNNMMESAYRLGLRSIARELEPEINRVGAMIRVLTGESETT